MFLSLSLSGLWVSRLIFQRELVLELPFDTKFKHLIDPLCGAINPLIDLLCAKFYKNYPKI
jgi:hypothetical protein